MGMGIYFVLFRPALLPEDYAYMGTNITNVNENIPLMVHWLQKVFWVLGCYIFSTGLMMFYISRTLFKRFAKGTFVIILVTGITSILSMTVINFIIQSDFKWILLLFTLPWLGSLCLYTFEKRQ